MSRRARSGLAGPAACEHRPEGRTPRLNSGSPADLEGALQPAEPLGKTQQNSGSPADLEVAHGPRSRRLRGRRRALAALVERPVEPHLLAVQCPAIDGLQRQLRDPAMAESTSAALAGSMLKPRTRGCAAVSIWSLLVLRLRLVCEPLCRSMAARNDVLAEGWRFIKAMLAATALLRVGDRGIRVRVHRSRSRRSPGKALCFPCRAAAERAAKDPGEGQRCMRVGAHSPLSQTSS
jgi:hypothetical protein